MSKRIARTSLLILMCVRLSALSINDTLNDSIGDITGGFSDYFGLSSFNVKCDTGIENIDLYSTCDIINSLDLSLDGEFKIGSCSVKTGDPFSCQQKALKKFCKDKVRGIENEIDSYSLQATNSIIQNGEELLSTGGKIIGDFSDCGYIKNTFENKKMSSGRTLKEIYNDSSVKMVKEHGLFNTVSEDIQDCLKSEKNEQKCFNTERWSLPATMSDAEEQIDTTVSQSISGTSSYIKGAIEIENDLAKKIQKKCNNSSNPDSCIQNASSGKDSHVKKRDNAIASVERSSSIRKKTLEKSSRTKRAVIFRGANVSNRLPIEMRTDYIDAVGRANAADIIEENLFFTNTELEKESIIILDNKITDSSEPFLEKASEEKIKNILGG